jgi:hypothetical protein
MRIRFLFLVVTMAALAPAAAEYSVNCEGSDAETSALVEGTCTDGDFTGQDSETGEQVSGSCEFAGDLSASNDDTGSPVNGECEGE